MQSIAVVPIFMSAGAAVMPTILTALASVLAILFKPRELLRVCRSRPKMALATLAITVLIICYAVLPRTPASRNSVSTAVKSRTDWSQVALEIIAREQVGAAPTGAAAPVPTAPTAHVESGPVGLRPLFSFKPEDTMFLSTPAISANRIYAAGCQSDLGSYTGLLACLDAETGKPIWQITDLGRDPLKPFFSSPTLTEDGKFLLIGQGLHQDRNCSLLCFDAATGKLRWSVKTPVHIESSPAISGDMVVVGAGAIEGADGKPIGDPGFVLAVRISDGKELWRQAVNDPESSPTIDKDGIVYIGSGLNGSAVVALRSETDAQLREKNLSRILWQAQVGLPVVSGTRIIDDLVITGAGNGNAVISDRNAQGSVIALDRKTGQVRWQTRLEDAVLGEIAISDGMVFCPVRTGEVIALSQKEGKILWRTRINGNSPIISGCTVAGGNIYTLSGDGYLGVVNAKDGKLIEKIPLNDQGKPGAGLSMSTPRVAGGRVIVGTETGGLRWLAGLGAKS